MGVPISKTLQASLVDAKATILVHLAIRLKMDLQKVQTVQKVVMDLLESALVEINVRQQCRVGQQVLQEKILKQIIHS